MGGYRKHKILSECRNLLKFMHLCVKTKIRIGSTEMPHVLIFVIQLIPQCFPIILETLNAYDIGLDFRKVSVTFMMLLGTVQMELIYICLAYNNNVLIETVDCIQDIVDQSISFLFSRTF